MASMRAVRMESLEKPEATLHSLTYYCWTERIRLSLLQTCCGNAVLRVRGPRGAVYAAGPCRSSTPVPRS